MLKIIFNIYVIFGGLVYVLEPNYQMTFRKIYALNMLGNVSLKVMYFDNISFIGRVYCKPEIPVNAHLFGNRSICP